MEFLVVVAVDVYILFSRFCSLSFFLLYVYFILPSAHFLTGGALCVCAEESIGADCRYTELPSVSRSRCARAHTPSRK